VVGENPERILRIWGDTFILELPVSERSPGPRMYVLYILARLATASWRRVWAGTQAEYCR